MSKKINEKQRTRSEAGVGSRIARYAVCRTCYKLAGISVMKSWVDK